MKYKLGLFLSILITGGVYTVPVFASELGQSFSGALSEKSNVLCQDLGSFNSTTSVSQVSFMFDMDGHSSTSSPQLGYIKWDVNDVNDDDINFCNAYIAGANPDQFLLQSSAPYTGYGSPVRESFSGASFAYNMSGTSTKMVEAIFDYSINFYPGWHYYLMVSMNGSTADSDLGVYWRGTSVASDYDNGRAKICTGYKLGTITSQDATQCNDNNLDYSTNYYNSSTLADAWFQFGQAGQSYDVQFDQIDNGLLDTGTFGGISTTTIFSGYYDDCSGASFFNGCIFKNGMLDIIGFFLIPHSLSLDYFSQQFNDMKNIFPFNVFFTFSRATRLELGTTLVPVDITLPQYGISPALTLIGESTLSDVFGSTVVDQYFSLMRNAIWLFSGLIMIRAILF